MNDYLQCVWVSFPKQPVRWSLSSCCNLTWSAADLISYIRMIIFGWLVIFIWFWVANTKFECIELYSAPDGSNIVNGKCNSGGNWQIQQCTYNSGICNIMPNLYHLLPYRMKIYTKFNLNNHGKNGQFNKLVPAGYMLIATMPESSAKLM